MFFFSKMKYLVLQSERSINFVVFDGPGYHLTVAGEKSDVPFYVRQHINNQSGAFSINEVSNYSGGSLFILTNSGCNIYVEDKLLPQGVSVMEVGKKFIIAKLTMFLIDEDDKSEVEDGKHRLLNSIFQSTF